MAERRRTVRGVAMLVAIGFALAGTSCKDPPTDPIHGVTVSANQDNFDYQATVRGFTGSRTYTWPVTGTTVSVTGHSLMTSGDVAVTLTDAAGTQVYQHNLATDSTFTSAAGTSGDWTVRITFSKADGFVGFSAVKVQ